MALNKITDMAFRNLKATDKVQIISDGGGLIIRVRDKKDGGAISYAFIPDSRQTASNDIESTGFKRG